MILHHLHEKLHPIAHGVMAVADQINFTEVAVLLQRKIQKLLVLNRIPCGKTGNYGYRDALLNGK